eukprot:TRINITY_DN2885_c0_g1_i2.p1 TRINITY_DN2885_c0_g1~~TRINITY_DN2885_c0_g1_i2.p1  ORF type:complete len:507 (+),score=75.85 TRINITY_DN2885_c0_g1_i2:50-1570(+)
MSLAEFVVLQKLGQGSYGVVYQAKRISDGQFYVLKKIDLARMSAKEQQDAVQEVKILASVDHPSIVKYYDSFLDRTHLCIVMELAKKGTIADRLKSLGSRKLQETVIWKWFLQICLGLKHLHDKRILHRDIKSTNVFLDSEENIKIGDLGLARVLDYSSQLASTMVGTPYYLSPELCENRPYNAKSDVWALGCTLYELCTLKHPFDATNQGALILKILRGKYPPITGYSLELKRFVDACLTRDSSSRPDVNQILSHKIAYAKAQQLAISLPDDILAIVQRKITASPSVKPASPPVICVPSSNSSTTTATTTSGYSKSKTVGNRVRQGVKQTIPVTKKVPPKGLIKEPVDQKPSDAPQEVAEVARVRPTVRDLELAEAGILSGLPPVDSYLSTKPSKSTHAIEEPDYVIPEEIESHEDETLTGSGKVTWRILDQNAAPTDHEKGFPPEKCAAFTEDTYIQEMISGHTSEDEDGDVSSNEEEIADRSAERSYDEEILRHREIEEAIQV